MGKNGPTRRPKPQKRGLMTGHNNEEGSLNVFELLLIGDTPGLERIISNSKKGKPPPPSIRDLPGFD